MKVLIADNNALFREALNTKITQIYPNAIVFQADTFAKSAEIFRKQNDFDLLIIDSDMPEMSLEHALNTIMSEAAKTKVVIVSESEDVAKIRKLFALGVVGYIPKELNSRIITAAIQLIVSGGKYLPSCLIESHSFSQPGEKANSSLLKPLTNRQAQVLDLVAQGKSNKQIAYDMGVSEATVKLHINALLRSLRVTNRTQAVITAQKMGLI